MLILKKSFLLMPPVDEKGLVSLNISVLYPFAT